MDAQELIDKAMDDADGPSARRLNALVAVTVALLATFLAICKVKDDNIVQGMQRAQAEMIDQWGFYQARQLREELAEATATELELARAGAPPAAQAAFDAPIARYRAKAADQAAKKDAVRAKAEAAEKDYARLNDRDDQFDLSEALLAIAIAMLAVTALTRLWVMFFASLLPTVFGVIVGTAGLMGLGWRFDLLSRLLG